LKVENIKNLIVTNVESEKCGAIVMWSLDGAVPYTALQKAWEDSGLEPDDCPSAPGASATLRSVLAKFAKGRRIVRPVQEGTFALLAEARTGDEENPLDHETVVVVRLSGDSELEFKGNREVAEQINEAFTNERENLGVTEFSMWLTTMVAGRCNGVPLRPRGGVYFVPADRIEVLEKISKVVEDVSSHKVYSIQALKSEDAVEAVIDAVNRETEEAINAIVEEAGAGELVQTTKNRTVRSVRIREERLKVAADKLESYERLLGVKSEAVRKRLEDAMSMLALIVMADPNAVPVL
jgi:hypothetical protein